MDALDAAVGVELPVYLPETRIVGRACIEAIESCPPTGVGPQGSRPVTGTLVTERAEVLNLYFQGLDKPITATPNHRFYSMKRGTWVTAAQLHAGDLVSAADGVVEFEHSEPLPAQQRTYNLEIQSSHTYFVSQAKIAVHNECTHPKMVKELRRRGFRAPVPTQTGGGKMYVHPNGTRVRIMPRPNRPPFPGEPQAKFAQPYYYRVSGPNGGPWGPHIPLKGG